jgi:hypothetical protein
LLSLRNRRFVFVMNLDCLLSFFCVFSKVFEKKKKRKANADGGPKGPNDELIRLKKQEQEDTANHGSD